MLGYTSARLDPLLIPADATVDRAMLELHLERYRLAAEFVRGVNVVDCACGTGYGSVLLLERGARSVQGVDFDREALEYARSRHAHTGITYYEADAVRFQPGAPVSAWVSMETLEHLPHPAAYVRHVAQQLPPGGWFIVSAPVSVSTDADQHHLHDFTRDELRQLLRAHGFREERSLEQRQTFTLRDLLERSPGLRPREHRRGLLSFYSRHPRVFGRRIAQSIRHGLVHEFLTIVATRSSS